METQTIKERLLLTWNLTYSILVIILFMPIIILLVILLILIAITDTYIGGIVYFIIWIINGTKNYWYITKKSACVFDCLIDKINLYK